MGASQACSSRRLAPVGGRSMEQGCALTALGQVGAPFFAFSQVLPCSGAVPHLGLLLLGCSNAEGTPHKVESSAHLLESCFACPCLSRVHVLPGRNAGAWKVCRGYSRHSQLHAGWPLHGWFLPRAADDPPDINGRCAAQHAQHVLDGAALCAAGLLSSRCAPSGTTDTLKLMPVACLCCVRAPGIRVAPPGLQAASSPARSHLSSFELLPAAVPGFMGQRGPGKGNAMRSPASTQQPQLQGQPQQGATGQQQTPPQQQQQQATQQALTQQLQQHLHAQLHAQLQQQQLDHSLPEGDDLLGMSAHGPADGSVSPLLAAAAAAAAAGAAHSDGISSILERMASQSHAQASRCVAGSSSCCSPGLIQHTLEGKAGPSQPQASKCFSVMPEDCGQCQCSSFAGRHCSSCSAKNTLLLEGQQISASSVASCGLFMSGLSH